MLQFLDAVLFTAHILIIGFNLLGWIKPSWRRLHFVIVSLTLFSWGILGFWFGFGYCFLTDWQWDIKRRLGADNLPNSFITYLLNDTLGFSLDPVMVDYITGVAFIPAVLLAIWFNIIKPIQRSNNYKE